MKITYSDKRTIVTIPWHKIENGETFMYPGVVFDPEPHIYMKTSTGAAISLRTGRSYHPDFDKHVVKVQSVLRVKLP